MATESDTLLTIRDYIRWGASRFNAAGLHFGHGTDNALDEAASLVLHALHLPLDLSDPYLDCRVTDAERPGIEVLLQRRIDERLPVAYLTGEAWFAGLPFFVNRDVLVPRSPIAELLERRLQPWISEDRVGGVLDLCSGSGCIGIAAALYFPDAEVDLAELSEPALAVARRNLERHGLQGRVQLRRSDLFAGLGNRLYDVILCNPPYVGEAELATLPEEYRKEPVSGLAGGKDGLSLVSQILRQASRHLNPWGIMILEVGNTAAALTERYPDAPFLWLEFERGGEGVCVLTQRQLSEYQDHFVR